MIITGILILITAFISKVASFLPAGSLPENVSSSLDYVVGWLHAFEGFFPVQTLITLIGYMIVVELSIVLWGFIKWLINVLRGSGA